MSPHSFGECCRHPPGRGDSLNAADPLTLQLIMDTLLADGHGGGWVPVRPGSVPGPARWRVRGPVGVLRPGIPGPGGLPGQAGRRAGCWCSMTCTGCATCESEAAGLCPFCLIFLSDLDRQSCHPWTMIRSASHRCTQQGDLGPVSVCLPCTATCRVPSGAGKPVQARAVSLVTDPGDRPGRRSSDGQMIFIMIIKAENLALTCSYGWS